LDLARLNRVAAVAANTFRESIRERVLYNLVFFAVVMILSGLVLKQLSIRQDEKIVKDVGLAAMDFFGTLIAVFIGVGLVSKEIERRSLYPLLAKPLSRDEFFVGKFLGLGFTLLVNTAVMTVGLAVTLLATRGAFDYGLLKAIVPLYLGLLLTVAIALLFSTLTSAPIAALGTLGVAIAGRYSDVLLNMKEVVPGGAGLLAQVLYYVLPNFRNFDIKNAVVYGDPIPWTSVGDIAAYAAVYITVMMLSGVLIFRGRDFV
jgi:ABC-type transport system involved in multi-copper enzyme maturation permease subunit